MNLPVLVDCEPYGARLIESTCARRWRFANGHAPKMDPRTRNAASDLESSSCRGCATGQARARLKPRKGARKRWKGAHPDGLSLAEDMTVGARFGGWEVTGVPFREHDGGRVRVPVRCGCGSRTSVLAWELRRGRSKHCKGCALRAREYTRKGWRTRKAGAA